VTTGEERELHQREQQGSTGARAAAGAARPEGPRGARGSDDASRVTTWFSVVFESGLARLRVLVGHGRLGATWCRRCRRRRGRPRHIFPLRKANGHHFTYLTNPLASIRTHSPTTTTTKTPRGALRAGRTKKRGAKSGFCVSRHARARPAPNRSLTDARGRDAGQRARASRSAGPVQRACIASSRAGGALAPSPRRCCCFLSLFCLPPVRSHAPRAQEDPEEASL
jgi:hypothetical protein